MRENVFAKFAAFPLLVSFFFVVNLSASTVEEKTFSDVSQISINTVSGNCIIKKASGSEVKIRQEHDFASDEFRVTMRQSGSRLILKEEFAWRSGSHSGNSIWELEIPDNIKVDFATASGNFEAKTLKFELDLNTASGNVDVSGCEGFIEASTASGEITITHHKGDVKLSTASGDIRVEEITGDVKCSTASGTLDAKSIKGNVKTSTASGNIRLDNIDGKIKSSAASGSLIIKNTTLKDKSKFSTASGDIKLSLLTPLEHDLKMSAASGDIELEYNNQKIRGYFEITVKNRGNRIKAPFKFDHEEIIEKWGRSSIVMKSAQIGESGPRVILSSASGSVTIRE